MLEEGMICKPWQEISTILNCAMKIANKYCDKLTYIWKNAKSITICLK